MYCKKCGTEQKEGQKFCPQCGTPYIDLEQEGVMNSNKDNIIEIREKTEEPVGKEQTQEQTNENQNNGFRPLNPNEEKKVIRIAKAGMWIILIAIVFTFVRAGFGFSFWWYLYLILLALVAIGFWGVTIPDSDSKAKTYNSNDVLTIKTFSWIGVIMLAILYLWGPLNSDYEISRDKSDSYSHEQSLSSDSYEQTSSSSSSSVSFSTEQDVRTFLCTNKFSSSDGLKISFSNNANELSINGKPITSYVEISLQGPSNAILRTHGPYGNTTFLLSVSGSEGYLLDKNDGTIYSN